MHLKVLLCLAAVFMCIHLVRGRDKVPVTVYYESLCPDSKKFFTSQLYPTLLNTNVSQWVNLTLVPYGKSTRNKVDDQWQFTCHHGPYECLGNKIQACALHEIEKKAPTPAGQGFNNITVAFINCLMDKAENITEPGKDVKYEFPIANCSEINHVPSYMDIENCEHHTDGSAFLGEMGDLTEKLQPPLKSVPTIVFNNKYKKEDSDLAQTNFVKALCQFIKNDKPTECKSSAATLTVSVLTFGLLLVKQLF